MNEKSALVSLCDQPEREEMVEISGVFRISVTKSQRSKNEGYTHACWLTDAGVICNSAVLGQQRYCNAADLHSELKTLVERTLRATFSHEANWCKFLYLVKFSFVADED